MKRIYVLACLALTSCDEPTVEWEHGFKNKYVVATRYRNDMFGFNIGFVFPKHPNDSDRAETFKFFSDNECIIFQGGGYPGAPLYAICKDVVDKDTANKKLIEFMPKLTAHIKGL